MVLGIVNSVVDKFEPSTLVTTALVGCSAYAVKVYAGGRKNIWERDWTGKLIMIVAPPEPTTLQLIDTLLHLPSPPQILYLPPLPSPLPDPLLTILHTLRLGITSPHGALHCEPLPPTPSGIRDFVSKWVGAPMGTVGEGGRRVDAIVLGGAWECREDSPTPLDPAEDPHWTPNQFHYHLITALLPALIRAPGERDIRLVQMVSPAWSAAIPGIQAGLEGRGVAPESGLMAAAAKRGVTSLLLQTHLSLVLNTLASAQYSKSIVPDPEKPKVRDSTIQSNILALTAVMPWARDEVTRPLWGSGSAFKIIMYLLFLPLIALITPSPTQSIQSVLYALSAPVKFPGEEEETQVAIREENNGEEKKKEDPDKITDPRRNGVRQGDVIRDCGVIDVPPVLLDPLLARATYEKLEGEVEAGVRASETRQKAYGKKTETAEEKTEHTSAAEVETSASS